MNKNLELAFKKLRESLDKYNKLENKTWKDFKSICTFKYIKKNETICKINEKPEGFHFVSVGLFRTFILNEKGVEYNKNFFSENMFPGSMVALLKDETSCFEIEALEDSQVIFINFKKYRELLLKYEDLKLFHIYYLEKNWLIHKDGREVDIVQKDADERYEDFEQNYPELSKRLTQYHIASHLGITPTQLSRIRKKRI